MASDGETWCANDPNFAVIYSFLKVFGKLYGLEVPTIAKLQQFIEDTQEVSDSLKELHLRLLRRALKSVHSNRWEKGMIKFCHQQGHHQEAWEIERFSYKKASTQVKLKVLKILLEYQFTCHPKFKTAVNAISCKELRLDPIGRDQNGCAYWLQVDDDANICLYKEDQDEETWQLIARNREELVKVIGQLKSGEEISPSQTANANEDSSGSENHVQENQVPEPQAKPEADSQKQVEDDDNEEEFLSPESESEQEETEQKDPPSNLVDGNEANAESSDPLDSTDTKDKSVVPAVSEQNDQKQVVDEVKDKVMGKQAEIDTTLEETKEKNIEISEVITDKVTKKSEEDELLKSPQCEESKKTEETVIPSEKTPDTKAQDTTETILNEVEEKRINKTKENEPVNDDSTLEQAQNSLKSNETSKDSESILEDKDSTIDDESKIEESLQNEVSEAIEEPVMLITGEGNGADCESFFIGEEISEPVMFFYGEGNGYENDTGNPEAIEDTNQTEAEHENGKEEVVNGEHEVVKTKTKLGKSVRLKTVNKRALKKQPNDVKPDIKKPCVRDVDKSQNSKVDNCLKREANINDKSTTDSENPRKNNVKKSRSKVKKKAVMKKLKLKRNGKDAINSLETDNCQDKTSIIEKRKSSVSSVDQDDNPTDIEKEKTPDKEIKVEDPLPMKKLRLETMPESDVNATHSKDVVLDCVEDGNNYDPISKRKKIKASKGKFKRKTQNNQELDKNNGIEKVNNSSKKSNKCLKRSLVAEPTSDKNKSESLSDSGDDEPITSGKRLKIKPKKIITSTRKKVEAKLLEKHSSDESEEETLYSLAGKKSTKKLVKKKPKVMKSKDKDKKLKAKPEKVNSEDSDSAPVRQSRRIAQQKIKEEAERRHLEEVALRELKMIHKKKSKDEEEEEEEWRASGHSSSEAEKKKKNRRAWHCSDSTGPEDSESDSPLFDHPEPEPEHDYGKSDHEFSPESDLETGESTEPLKRARTLQEEKDDGFCKRCGSGEQPEWILLCDGCDAGYHASCLTPVLFVVPEGDWFCPPCNHDKLIKALEEELVKYDELLAKVEEERARKKLEEPEPAPEVKKPKEEADSDGRSDSSWSSSSDEAAVYRLRARRQLPVSVRSQEYDRIISAAIKEEYVEPTTSAGNQGRGKDISTIIEAAEEEKMKAEREAIEQGKPVETMKKQKKKQRRKPRKLNSLEVPSEDDDETDEDFKDVGGASSSEDISSSADKESSDSRSSDSLPIRRTGRTDKKDRPKLRESSPETKKKKKLFADSSSESAGAKEWNSSKPKSKSRSHSRPKKREKRDKSKKKSRGLTQYDADGNVIRARVTYGGLSGGEGDGENDWSPKHRTRQKKINYTEMPNTESEDEMHKSSGKHMPDSSDEFKCSDTEFDTDSDSDRTKKRKEEENAEREKALSDLVKKTAVVPLEKLPEDVTKAKTEELEAHLNAQQAMARPLRGKGSRGGRGSRGPRGRGGGRSTSARASSPQTDDALAKLVGVKIKELGQDGSPVKASQLEREKKRQEREAKLAEKEAKKLERLQKKEEKEKLKEQKAKEREEKRLARLALQESKRIKKEKEYMSPMGGYGVPVRPMGAESPRVNNMGPMAVYNHMRPRPPTPGGHHPQDGAERYPNTPRLQVRPELRGVAGDPRAGLTREGTLSVAGSPQPFKPVSEEPSIITRMPHMINQQYRGPMMYGSGGGGAANYAGRQSAPGGVYGMLRYPPHYYRLPPYSAPPHNSPHHHPPPPLYSHLQGGGGPSHGSQGPLHHSGGYYRPAGAGPCSSPAGEPVPSASPHGMPAHQHHMGPHNVPGIPFPRSPGPNQSPGAPTPPTASTGLTMAARLMGPGSGGPLGAPSGPPGGPSGPPGGPSGPPGAPSGPSSQPPPEQDSEPQIKIKAEVKTEPEYRSPVASPGASSPGDTREEPPRHPKIKVTEVRERRPRFPLGPYAPHLAPYRPYAPVHGQPLHAGPGHHPGLSSHPGPAHHVGPTHPGQGPSHLGQNHPGQSHLGPPHPGQTPHHPGAPHRAGPHPGQGPSLQHPGPSHLGQSHYSRQGPSPGPGSHHPGGAHPGLNSHQGSNLHHPTLGPLPLHPGLHPHPGQGPSPGPGPHPGTGPHSGPSPQHPGPGSHPGAGPHLGLGPLQHHGQSSHSGPGNHVGPGPSPQHTGPGPNSGPIPHHPGQGPHPSTPSPHHPGQNSASSHLTGHGPHLGPPQHQGSHPGPNPHHGQNPQPGLTSHQTVPISQSGTLPHRPGQSPQHPGPSSHHMGPSPNHPGPSPHHPRPSPSHQGPTPHHPGPTPSPQGPTPHHSGTTQSQQGPTPHHPGPTPSPQGPTPHHPGTTQSQQGPTPHHPGPTQSHQGPTPHHPGTTQSQQGPTPHHPGPTQSHQGPTPHHPGPTQSHQGPTPHHPGPTQSHQGPTPHPLLRDPSQFKTERDPSPPPSGVEDRPYPPGAGRGFPPTVRSPLPPGGPPYTSGPYTPGTAGNYPPAGAPGPYGGAGFAGRFPSNGRGFPPGVRPFQFPPRPHLPTTHTATQPSQPPPAKSPAGPLRVPSHSPHPPKPAGRGSMPFPARTQSPKSAQPERSPPYYDRRPVVSTQPASRDPPQEGDSSPTRGQRRLESLETATSPGTESPPRVKVEREEGVFGGLVSYFSSQHEDDMDG